MTAEVRDWRKREESLEKRGSDLTDRLFSLAENGDLVRLRATVAAWEKQADAPEPSDDRRLMRQVLRGASVTAGESARAQLAQQNYDQAIACLELSVILRPEHAWQTYYELARAQALNGGKKQALAALQQAANAGFNDTARVEQETAFAGLRKSPAFQELLKAMRSSATPAAAGSALAKRP